MHHAVAVGQPFVMEKLLRHASSLNTGAIMLQQSNPTCRPCAEYQGPAYMSSEFVSALVQLEGVGCTESRGEDMNLHCLP